MSSISPAEAPRNGDFGMYPFGKVTDLELRRRRNRHEECRSAVEYCRLTGENLNEPVLNQFFHKLHNASTVFSQSGQRGLPDWVKKGLMIVHAANSMNPEALRPEVDDYLLMYREFASLYTAGNDFERLGAVLDEFWADQKVLANTVFNYASQYIRPGQPDPRPLAICGAVLAHLTWDRARDSSDESADADFAKILELDKELN